MGLIAPAWYLAPQRREVAEAAWNLAAAFSGVATGGPVNLIPDPQILVTVLQLAGEFASTEERARLWAAAENLLEPSLDRDLGEVTYGFKLGEPHPRGQLNARAAAGFACSPGAWSNIFNRPNLAKFEQPTIVGVDFPRVVLSEAWWDAQRRELNVRAEPQNESVRRTRTQFRVTNVTEPERWTASQRGAEPVAVQSIAGDLVVEMIVDGSPFVISQR